MSKLEDKTVEVMDKVMVVAERLTEKMSDLATQYGPDVVNAGIEVARITAAGNLLSGAGCAVIAYCCAKFGIGMFKKAATKRDSHNAKERGYIKADISEYAESIPGVIGCGVAGLLTVPAAIDLLNIWNWVGVIEPKLWIAHRILEKAL